MISVLFLIILLMIFLFWNPYNLATVILSLHVVFYVLPALDRIYQLGIFSFQLFSYDYRSEHYWPLFNSVNRHIIFFCLPFLFFPKGSIYRARIDLASNKRRIIFIAAAQIFWVLTVGSLQSKLDSSLLELFVPSRKQGLITSGYQKLFLIYLPWVLSLTTDKRKVRIRGIFDIQTFLTVLLTGQRRFIISFIIYLILRYLAESRKNNIRMVSAAFGGALLISVPGFWYLRSYFTQLSRGSVEVNPLSTRSPIDLIFGSSSSGYETLLFFDLFAEKLSIGYLSSFFYIFTSYVPRSLWLGKPMSIPNIIKLKMGWMGNPSVFLGNELHLNFGVYGFVFSTVLAIIILTLVHVLASRDRVYLLMVFPFSIALFKNGFSYFLTEYLLFVLVYAAAKSFCGFKRIN